MNDNKFDELLSKLPANKIDAKFNDRLFGAIERRKNRRAVVSKAISYAGGSATLSILLLLLFNQLENAYKAAENSGYIQFMEMMFQDISVQTISDLLVAIIMAFPIADGIITLTNILAIILVVKLLNITNLVSRKKIKGFRANPL